MVHRRIKLVFALVMLALLPFSPAQPAQAAVAPTLVKDINPGAGSSFPDQFVATNGTLFFWAEDARKRPSLWKSDGTTAGTTLLKATGFPNPVAVVGNTFYFGVSDSLPYSLWKSDGTSAGTSKVADVAADFTNRKSGVAFQGKLFFAAGTPDPADLTLPLWSSDGTAGGTVPITFAGSENQRVLGLVATDNFLYFNTIDKRRDASSGRPINGQALYRSDGTAAGTQKLLQIDNDSPVIDDLTPKGDSLFFRVDDDNPANDDDDRHFTSELWASDGTVTGTAPLADATGHLVDQARGLFNFNGLIIFRGGPTDDKDTELWRSDGTSAGTYRIKDINPGPGSSTPGNFTVFDNLLYFTARDNTDGTEVGTFGAELWRSDGTEAGTSRVTDLNPGSASSAPFQLIVFNGALYFAADNGGGFGSTLWRSDGTAGGTVQLSGQAFTVSNGHDSISVVNNSLFFAADDGRTGVELWKLSANTGRVRTGLRALYDFHEGTGSVVHDVAGAGNPLDLTIKKPSQVRWGAGNLEVTGFTPIASSGPATKLIAAAKTSDAVTVEAWITPATVAQYSARILTISPNATVRNLTLAQGVFNQNDATLASLRIRTTATASSGQEVFSPSGSVQPALTHLVGTVAADGMIRIYVNGAQVTQAQASGTLDNWNPSYPLILAGEQPSGRGWRGTYHLVAIYDHALSAVEVQQNYAAGPEAP